MQLCCFATWCFGFQLGFVLKLRKHLYFLDGDTSKSKIEDLNIDPSDFTYSGPKVMYGVTKSLNKLNSDI